MKKNAIFRAFLGGDASLAPRGGKKVEGGGLPYRLAKIAIFAQFLGHF